MLPCCSVTVMGSHDQGLGIPMETHCLKKVNILKIFVTESGFHQVRISVIKKEVAEFNRSVI